MHNVLDKERFILIPEGKYCYNHTTADLISLLPYMVLVVFIKL